MLGVLNRYILREIAVPFALGLVILTATALLSKVVKIVELVLTHGVGVPFVLRFIASTMPSFLIYTIPISFLAAVLIAFTRLSSDNEIVAMKASGLSLFTLARPVLALASVVFTVALSVTLVLFPWGNRNLKALIVEAGKTNLAAGLEERTFYDRFEGTVLYVEKFSPESGVMEGIFISQRDGGGSTLFFAPRGVITASGGEFSMYLRLYDGTIHRRAEGPGEYHIAEFASYTLELSAAGAKAAAANSERHNRELTAGELLRAAKEKKARGEDPSPYLIDLHKRLALPASVFVFALMGVPLGIQKIRSARLTGFSMALGVVLAYYLASTAFEALGENGTINAVFSVWASDLAFLAAGFYIFRRAAREESVGLKIFTGWLNVLRRPRKAL